MKRLVFVLTLGLLTGLVLPASAQSRAQQPPDGVAVLLSKLEAALQGGKPAAFLDLLSLTADRRRAADFAAATIVPGITRVVLKERERNGLEGALPGDGYQLMVEGFIESGNRAKLATWSLDVRRRGDSSTGEDWGVAGMAQISSLGGLYRLTLNTQKQYATQNLAVTAEDLRLAFDGSVFLAETEAGPTALVLVGRGDMTFSPSPRTEKGQVRLFAGADALKTPFDAAFLRVSPSEVSSHLDITKLTERPVDPRDVHRAEEIFKQDVGKSFGLDLGDLSNDTWSLLPNAEDFLAEIRTSRFDILSYAKSSGEVENISLFDRQKHRNISTYASTANIERFGRFWDEDTQADVVVRDYDVDVSYLPERTFLTGRAKLLMEVKGGAVNAVTLRLAEPLNVESVTSLEFGRLLTLRVRNQNSLVVNLPGTLVRGSRLTLFINYSGVLPPQMVDRETISTQAGQGVQGPQNESELPVIDSYLYSTRSYWYPQPTISGYSTGRIAVTVPSTYGVAASGEFVGVEPRPPMRGQPARRHVFQIAQPARYFAFIVTPFFDGKPDTVHIAPVVEKYKDARGTGVYYDSVDLRVKTSPRLQSRGREVTKTADDIMRFYASLVGDAPYPDLTLAVIEKNTPGGHSPAYLAIIGTPMPGANLSYRDDPAAFPDFPEFFVAHELAHQWWGQAVGWKNYHEQWLSEGFAQYFAALYAEKARGHGVFESMMRRMRRWAVEKSGEGPVYLGYRVGHVKGDQRLFRALIYNKSAVVLDMLRQLIGDEAFFNGVRRFYTSHRFRKAGSDDLRVAMEEASGKSLSRFFDRWIYGEDLPQLNFTVKIDAPDAKDGGGAKGQSAAVLRFEQAGDVFDFPLTVTLEYLDKPPVTLHYMMTDKVLEARVPLVGAVRRIDIDRENTTVGTIKEALVTRR